MIETVAAPIFPLEESGGLRRLDLSCANAFDAINAIAIERVDANFNVLVFIRDILFEKRVINICKAQLFSIFNLQFAILLFGGPFFNSIFFNTKIFEHELLVYPILRLEICENQKSFESL